MSLTVIEKVNAEGLEPVLNQTTLNLVVRAELDAVRDILGENAAAIVYRKADLIDIF